MPTLATLLGALAGLTLAFVMATNRPYDRHPDAVTLAWAMVGIWVVCTLADILLMPPHSKGLNGPLDAGMGALVVALMIGRRDVWKLPLLALLAVQGVMDFSYQASSSETIVLWWYTFGLNVTFILQLVCIAWPGGRYVVTARRDRRRWPGAFHPGATSGLGGGSV